MNKKSSEPTPVQNHATMERKSDRETVVTRTFDAPAHILFETWSKSELFRQWWVPRSYGLSLLSCEMDVRVGGRYRLEFGDPASEQPMAFFGTYIEVIPNACIAWTNEESEEGAVTTVTFEEFDGKTMLVVHDLYPSKEVLDNEIACGATGGMGETLDQLDALIVAQERLRTGLPSGLKVIAPQCTNRATTSR
jgi:uncharacterized protein YndB with AHSA1/START domain